MHIISWKIVDIYILTIVIVDIYINHSNYMEYLFASYNILVKRSEVLNKNSNNHLDYQLLQSSETFEQSLLGLKVGTL